MLQLIFRPEGIQPAREDFRILGSDVSPPPFSLSFSQWEQVINHLVENAWPADEKPWVLEGTLLHDPADISRRMPG